MRAARTQSPLQTLSVPSVHSRAWPRPERGQRCSGVSLPPEGGRPWDRCGALLTNLHRCGRTAAHRWSRARLRSSVGITPPLYPLPTAPDPASSSRSGIHLPLRPGPVPWRPRGSGQAPVICA
ncbi:hypothetical protein NDU88_005171 [Pleurodeles waltl]|uniref:Uncharacterized protein n=1 Tax=Pleurodeles waltl TaxID=8319 RepID=A0AAV7WB87_PLEWA|nr:hypothetical protein NDU88_005171 [Pleurodeles waltl]